MLRAFSTLGCPDFSLPEALALAARFALDAVELRALSGAVDLPGYFARHYTSPEDLAAVLNASPVRVLAFDTSFKLIGARTKDRASLLAFVPWAEAAGVPWLRVFDGGHAGSAPELAEAAENLHWWREQRARHGWQVDWMVETHDSLLTAAAIQHFAAALPGAHLLWDAHHTWRKGGEDPVVTWTAIAPLVVHVHVKDSVSQPDGPHPFTYVLPGSGEFPAQALLRTLRPVFSGAVSLEWERLWHPSLPPLESALKTARERQWW